MLLKTCIHTCSLDCVQIVSVFPQMGQFYYAAKAFDVLERLDPNPEYWEGKRGACVGVFQLIIAGHEPRYVLFITLKSRIDKVCVCHNDNLCQVAYRKASMYRMQLKVSCILIRWSSQMVSA